MTLSGIRQLCLTLVWIFPAVHASLAWSQQAGDTSRPKAVPATRDEMKGALDRLKSRQPRLPLPPPTPEEEEQAKQNTAARGLGGGLVNNARMRNRYLPEELRGTGFSRDPDPVMQLKAPFITELFWIASRVNNCHYCLGHQETKLAADGLTEDQVAALDGDWSDQSPARQAAFAFTRKLTYEPHRITDSDVATLAQHYPGLQPVEIVYLVARYNATNRWTDSLGIPQEGHRDYLTPTAAAIQKRPSGVAPLPAAKVSAVAVDAPRPALEPRGEVERLLSEARTRQPRFPLLSEAEARQMKSDLPAGPLPAYIRLLAHFPKTGVGAIQSQLNLEQFGKVSPLLKARIAWVAARHDHAWYALDHARAQLRALKQTDDQIFALDTLGEDLSEGDKLALQLTRKLTVTPQWITDDDIAGLRKVFPDAEVAEIVYRITQAAQFNRLTEAAGLPCDSPLPG